MNPAWSVENQLTTETPVQPPRRRGRWALGALLALALLTGAVGGGMVGAVAATRWLAPQPTAQPAPIQATSETVPVAQVIAPSASTAGTTASASTAGQVFKKVNPSIVQLNVSGTANSLTQSGSGSGIVVDAAGYVLTNQHVIDGARTISVRFANGASREGQVLGTDTGNDLAVVKVDLPAGVPAAPLGDSDQVGVGDTAIVIGSPFSLDQTVTQGIISAVHRTWTPGDGRVRRNLLQTDAAVNPGNSGGALLNASGQVIGITSMIESPVRGNVGVGFAIPINTARKLVPQLEAGAKLQPVWLGITGQPVDEALAKDQSLPVQEGVLVLSTVAGGPAAQAGLKGGQTSGSERIARGGDVIVAMNGQPVKDLGEVTDALVGHSPGEALALTVYRDGKRQDLNVTLQVWPS